MIIYGDGEQTRDYQYIADAVDGYVISEDIPAGIIVNTGFGEDHKIIDIAKISGADAVKLQTYHPDTITMNMNTPEFIINGGLWDGQSLYELY